jgi:hypothetical protein
VFGCDPARMIEAEQSSASAYLEIGIVGGPFPWRDALALPWPQAGAGQRVGDDEPTPTGPEPTPGR